MSSGWSSSRRSTTSTRACCSVRVPPETTVDLRQQAHGPLVVGRNLERFFKHLGGLFESPWANATVP